MTYDKREFLVDEDARRHFERDWSGQSLNNLQRLLPDRHDQRYLATLEELIHIDLELAWRAWEKQRENSRPSLLEAYLAFFPDLYEGEILGRLARQEYRVRQATGDEVTMQDYIRRFPTVFASEDSFRAALDGSGFTLDLPSTFSVLTGMSTVDVGPGSKRNRSGLSAVGSRIRDFEIEQELGRGGMGVVYRARDVRLGRDVALKMILGGPHASSQHLERFLVEARAAAQLQHANIVQVYESGEHEGVPFLAMEYVAGATLASRLAGKPQPPMEAAQVVETLARTIQYAHERRILHRDLKPSNVLLAVDDTPKISDFGLAKHLEDDVAATKTGTILGTPCYMSPEQARGAVKEVGPASDQYSLGTILYEMLTGRPPFLAADSVETIFEVIHNEPVSLRQLQPTVPADLETICLRALQKDPAKRYASAGELAEDLRRFREGEPICARPVGRLERSWRWCRRKPLVASLTAASLLLLLATTVISVWSAVTFAAKNAVITERNQAITAQNIKITQQNQEITKQNAEIKIESDKARRQEKLASERANMAMTAYQTLITEVQLTIADTPQTQHLKMALLKAAADGMDRMSGEMAKTTAADPTLAAALMKMADELHGMGQSEQAVALYRRVYDLVKPRPEIMEGSDASRFNVARALWNLAIMDEELQRDMQAHRKHNAEALSILQDIWDRPSSGEGSRPKWLTEYGLAEGHQRMGVSLMRLGQSAQAVKHYLRALELRQGVIQRVQTEAGLTNLPPHQKAELQQAVATSQLALGEALARSQSLDEARACFEQAIRIREAVFQADANDITAKQFMGRAAGMWAEFRLYAGELEEAMRQIDLSCRLAEELAAADPANADYQRDLGVAFYRRGVISQACGDGSASDSFGKCREIRQRLSELSPRNEKLKRELMLALAHTDEIPAAAGLAREFRRQEKLDNEVLIDIARCLAQCALRTDSREEVRMYQDEAIEALSSAIHNAFQDALLLEYQADLQPLQGVTSFQQLLNQLRTQPSPSADDPRDVD